MATTSSSVVARPNTSARISTLARRDRVAVTRAEASTISSSSMATSWRTAPTASRADLTGHDAGSMQGAGWG